MDYAVGSGRTTNLAMRFNITDARRMPLEAQECHSAACRCCSATAFTRQPVRHWCSWEPYCGGLQFIFLKQREKRLTERPQRRPEISLVNQFQETIASTAEAVVNVMKRTAPVLENNNYPPLPVCDWEEATAILVRGLASRPLEDIILQWRRGRLLSSHETWSTDQDTNWNVSKA